MLNPLKDNTIETRVMRRVRQLIAAAQKSYDEKVAALVAKHKQRTQELDRQLEVDKDQAAEMLVNGILKTE